MNIESREVIQKDVVISSQLYIMLTAFMALFAVVGFAGYGLPFYYDFLSNDFGWTRTTVTSGNAVGKILVGPLFGCLAGYLIDYYGPRKLMMTGALCAGVALIGLGLSSSLTLFFLFCIMNAIGYVLCGPLPCQVIISRWFSHNRGKAMGIAYLGIGLGGAIVPLLSASLVKTCGWHIALMALGVGVILIAFPMAFFIRDPDAARLKKTKTEIAVPFKKILKARNFYLLAVGSLLSIGSVGGIGAHLKYYLRDHNYTQLEAAHVMSAVLVASLAGRVMMGFLADVICRKYVMLLLYFFVACSIPLLLMPAFAGRIFLFSVLFGVGIGGNYMIIPLMAADLFGVMALGRTMGIILVADNVAEAGLPMFVAFLYNPSTKSYSTGFIILTGLTILGAVIISFLPAVTKIKAT